MIRRKRRPGTVEVAGPSDEPVAHVVIDTERDKAITDAIAVITADIKALADQEAALLEKMNILLQRIQERS